MSSSPSPLDPAGTIAYEEPSLPHLLTLVAFLYLVQVARHLANSLIGAGLVGEIAVGVVFGPVARILVEPWQDAFLAVGYVGLVLIVFEGGLTLDVDAFVPLLPLATASALVGIVVPLAFSFALFSSSPFSYPPLEAFTCGAALSSTSLGTTFYVLKSAGHDLASTKVAQVLKGAALVDDIVALVLLSVISSLAGGQESGQASLGWTIGRPIVASVAMCLVTPVAVLYVVRPLYRVGKVEKTIDKYDQNARLFVGVAVLSAFLAIAYYAGTTVLLGAFLAGVTLPLLPSTSSTASPYAETYDSLLSPIQNHVLVPLFFASIGFSIPFLELWTGRIVWRGIVYSVLMCLGKVVVGITIVVFDSLQGRGRRSSPSSRRSKEEALKGHGQDAKDDFVSVEAVTAAERTLPVSTSAETFVVNKSSQEQGTFASETVPAAAFLGFALVARGEIGILVLQVAYTASATSPTPVLTTEPYLVSIWAVAVCTIVGPVVFSIVVKGKAGERIARGKWGL